MLKRTLLCVAAGNSFNQPSPSAYHTHTNTHELTHTHTHVPWVAPSGGGAVVHCYCPTLMEAKCDQHRDLFMPHAYSPAFRENPGPWPPHSQLLQPGVCVCARVRACVCVWEGRREHCVSFHMEINEEAPLIYCTTQRDIKRPNRV